MIDQLPILSISGWSGSGKTTLIESLIPSIKQMGIHLAVLKHVSHHFQVDREGKDSERFFRAGADVFVHNPDETFFRTHKLSNYTLESVLLRLIRFYDMIIVEGHKQTPLPKFWLSQCDETIPKDVVEPVIQSLGPNESRKTIVLEYIKHWLPQQWNRTPVFGCVLIGGKSVRMGQPKHLICDGHQTWLEKILNILNTKTELQVIVGEGELPERLNNVIRLPDVMNAAGPMAGILSAMRWNPMASWIVCACDMPALQPEALDWLLNQRKPGCWLIAPQKQDSPFPEPLPALYDLRIIPVLEQQAYEHFFKISDLADHPKAQIVPIPNAIHHSWKNFNTPEELNP